MEKVVLAYSGGLDTSIIIPWLREERGLEVHACAGDVGQGTGELDGLEEKALATGAASCRVFDLREADALVRGHVDQQLAFAARIGDGDEAAGPGAAAGAEELQGRHQLV